MRWETKGIREIGQIRNFASRHSKLVRKIVRAKNSPCDPFAIV